MTAWDFHGRTVLVTGASRGIGRAIAQAFAAQGAKTYGTATTPTGAEAISAYLGGAGAGLVMDARRPDSGAQLFAAVEQAAGRGPDILVNNAGITRDGLFLRMKDADWEDVLTCDLTAHARLTRLCLGPMLKNRYGRIVSVASVVGETGQAGQCNYAAAKAGLIGFSRALAREVGRKGVTVNCVAPGFVLTDMTAGLKPAVIEAWTEQIPLNRAGRPEDIAGAVLFLASDLASYITGTTLDVNGGMYCR